MLNKTIKTTVKEFDLIVRLRTSDLSLYDGNVDNSLRWDGHANCDDPEQDILSSDYLFAAFLNYYMRWRSHNVLFSFTLFIYTIPVCHLYFVISLKIKYVFYYFCPLGQQESTWCFLLQSKTGQQLKIRLDIIPSHHFWENRKHRADGCDPSVIWKTANVQIFRKVLLCVSRGI